MHWHLEGRVVKLVCQKAIFRRWVRFWRECVYRQNMFIFHSRMELFTRRNYHVRDHLEDLRNCHFMLMECISTKPTPRNRKDWMHSNAEIKHWQPGIWFILNVSFPRTPTSFGVSILLPQASHNHVHILFLEINLPAISVNTKATKWDFLRHKPIHLRFLRHWARIPNCPHNANEPSSVSVVIVAEYDHIAHLVFLIADHGQFWV